MAKTSDYYKKNPAARKRRLKQQAKYNKTKKHDFLKNLVFLSSAKDRGMVQEWESVN